MEVGNITKAAAFKKFSSPKLLKHTIRFFVTVPFNIFIRQTLTDDFWGLHKNMNCAFPLTLVGESSHIFALLLFSLFSFSRVSVRLSLFLYKFNEKKQERKNCLINQARCRESVINI